MKKLKKQYLPFDSSDFLRSPKAIKVYLSDALKTNDPEFIAFAIGQVAKAQGMTEVAKKAGLSRQSLYKALSGEAKAEFATILSVLAALGYALDLKDADKKAA